ncbi:MAG: serine hydrolase [Candidatus Sericytochromatia bacterium]|nr:serine hydrolase [Candidatus Sericytochromatia bacterium]
MFESASNSSEWSSPPAPILTELTKVWEGFSGSVNLAVWHRFTGEKWAVGAAVWPAASLIKLPLSIAAYAAGVQGTLNLNDTTEVADDFFDPEADFDHLTRAPGGTRFTWRKIIDRALTESDNGSTNALISHLGLGAIGPLTEALGLRSTVLARKMLDVEARSSGRENTTSCQDMATLLVALAEGTLLPPADTKELLALLGQQRSREKLAFGLPSKIRFAHKTGELPGYRHDVGLVGDDCSWAIAMMCAGAPEEDGRADQVMSETMKRVVDWMAQQEAREAVAQAWLSETRRQMMSDPRLHYDNVSLVWRAGHLTLTGKTTIPDLLSPPRSLHIQQHASHLGGEKAVVSVPCLQLRGGPGHHHELVSQARLGEQLEILDGQTDWVLLRSADGYVAWGKSNNVVPRASYRASDRICKPLISGRTSDQRWLQLSAGTCLERLEDDIFRLPDGATIQLPQESTKSLAAQGTVAQLLEFAKEFLGLPYLWGGTTGWGIDCSGLTQLAYQVMGISLPRDADQQQAFLPVVGRLSDLEPGDLVFFPGHVGLYLGRGEYIHAGAMPGCVTINSFDSDSPRFDQELRATFTGGAKSPIRQGVLGPLNAAS